MEQNSQHREALLTQIKESFGRIVYTYTTHLKKMNRIIKKNKRIKLFQIILSAISTGGFLGGVITNELIIACIGGVFSTALLGVNLYFKEFNLLDEVKLHQIASDNLWLIREDYISLLTDFNTLSETDIVKMREELKERTFEIYKTSPKTDSKSYVEAQKALKSEEEQFFSAEELDKMLPAHLRSKQHKSV